MKILVTGGCGNMGPHIIRKLSELGHTVRTIDLDKEGLRQFDNTAVETVCGNLNDRELTRSAVNGVDAIIHLAWSFSGSFAELMDIDIKGYLNLLDAAVEYNVKHVINTTTAVSYGKPLSKPVNEDQMHQVSLSRGPAYALAKLTTEELSRIYAREYDLQVNSMMVWYAFGDVIGGRNLRAMIKDAIVKGEITIPAGSGGSFIQLDDYVTQALVIMNSGIKGELFNAVTVYLTWEDVAKIIVNRYAPSAKVNAIPHEQWTGSVFLTDDWPLSTEKSEKLLGFKSAMTRKEAMESLGKALDASATRVRRELTDV